jgi:hypothetical protein
MAFQRGSGDNRHARDEEYVHVTQNVFATDVSILANDKSTCASGVAAARHAAQANRQADPSRSIA